MRAVDTAIAHGYEDVEDGLFEEVRTCGAEAFEQLRGNLGAEPRHARVDLFQWIECGFIQCQGRASVGGRRSRCRFVVAVGRDPAEFALAEAIGVVGEETTPEVGDGVCRAAGAGECFCSGQGGDCPPDAVVEAELTGVDGLGPLLVGQPDVVGDQLVEVSGLEGRAVAEDPAAPGGGNRPMSASR